MSNEKLKWFYIAALSVMWGSSFILIKKGLVGLTAMQMGSLRIVLAAIILFVAGFKSLPKIKRKDWKPLIVSGFLGTFFPSFLFAYAETRIDSSIASMLNATTPLFAMLFGAFTFGILITRNQIIGVAVGFLGSLALIGIGSWGRGFQEGDWFAGLVLLSSLCYACNVNIIKKHLQELPPMAIAVGNFSAIVFPAFVVLLCTGFFKQLTLEASSMNTSILAVLLLAIVGTAIAKVLFNKLVQVSTPVFASSVTYTIPLVALIWGLLDGEEISLAQGMAAMLILIGVFIVNRKAVEKKA